MFASLNVIVAVAGSVVPLYVIVFNFCSPVVGFPKLARLMLVVVAGSLTSVRLAILVKAPEPTLKVV